MAEVDIISKDQNQVRRVSYDFSSWTIIISPLRRHSKYRKLGNFRVWYKCSCMVFAD